MESVSLRTRSILMRCRREMNGTHLSHGDLEGIFGNKISGCIREMRIDSHDRILVARSRQLEQYSDGAVGD